MDSNSITDEIRQYIQTLVTRIKYEVIDKASAVIAEVALAAVMTILALLTLLSFTVTLALLAGKQLESAWEGFACITVFYALLFIVSRLLRISLQNFFIRLFIQKIFRKQ